MQINYVTHTSVLEWKTLRVDIDMPQKECIGVFSKPNNSSREKKLES